MGKEKATKLAPEIFELLDIEAMKERSKIIRRGLHGISPQPLSNDMRDGYRSLVFDVRLQLLENLDTSDAGILRPIARDAFKILNVPHARETIKEDFKKERLHNYNPQMFHAFHLRSQQQLLKRDDSCAGLLQVYKRAERVVEVLMPDDDTNKVRVIGGLLDLAGVEFGISGIDQANSRLLGVIAGHEVIVNLTPNNTEPEDWPT